MWHITLVVMVINTTGAIFLDSSHHFCQSWISAQSLSRWVTWSRRRCRWFIMSSTADKVQRIGLGVLLILSCYVRGVWILVPTPLLSQSYLLQVIWLQRTWLSWKEAYWWCRSYGWYDWRLAAFMLELSSSVPGKAPCGRVAGITGSLFKLLMPFGLAASGCPMTMFGLPVLFVSCFV